MIAIAIVVAIVIAIAVAILSYLFAVHLDEIPNSLGGNSILLSNFVGVHLEDGHIKYYVSYLIIRQHSISPHYPLVVHVASDSADVVILSVDLLFPDIFRIF